MSRRRDVSASLDGGLGEAMMSGSLHRGMALVVAGNGGERAMAENMRRGGCNCGKVRIEVRGEPVRVGLCHCLTCRKETGGPFMAFAIWDKGQVSVSGETASWTAATDHRHFCRVCGSALFATQDGDDGVEVRLGALDEAPSDLVPGYELWTPRREHWLSPVAGATQHPGNRP